MHDQPDSVGAEPDRKTSLQLAPPGGRRTIREYSLEVVRGAERGKTVRVRSPRFRIGALPGADLLLSDPAVSGLHCELVHTERGVRLQDLGSRNGTFVNGLFVTDATLTGRATLELGGAQLAFKPEHGGVEIEALADETFGPLVGRSVVMRELFATLAGYAPRDATVLIQGETGVGKELVAEAIVQASPRAEKPLVVIDCSALAPTLIESELFGHERGAFTGATSARPGAFERANGGTIFLDEVGELPLELQPRLLRALERREVQRLGGKGPIAVDVRVLAATHRPLEQEVNEGRFRPDLFFRLSVLRVVVPPLRERPDDVAVLAQHFLGSGATMDAVTLARFTGHPWPGNVRELRNAVERWKAGAEPLSPMPTAKPSGPASIDLDQPFLVQKERLVNGFEKAYAKALLAVCDGNLSEAARRAGVSRMAIVKMLGRLGMLDDVGAK